MKLYSKLISLGSIIFITGTSFKQSDHVEFVCFKTHKASNTCHFNFKIEGAKYRYVDTGCKMSKKKEDVIKKAKEGKLGLAKDWKIECFEIKN